MRAEANLPGINQTYYSDFDKIYPWSEIGRYLVNKDTKAIRCKLDFTDSNREAITMRKIDWAAEEATSDVDVIIPIFAVKIWLDDTGKKHIQVQKSNPILSGLNDGFVIHPAFVRADGSLRDKIHIAAFEACDINNQLRSIPNKTPLRSVTIDTARTKARTSREVSSNIGTIDTLSVIQILYLVEYASLNSQNKLGRGFNIGVDPWLPNNSGLTLNLGDRSGYTGGDNRCMSYRGIENVYGNKWEVIDGLIICDDGYYIHNDSRYFGDRTKYNFVPANIENDVSSKRGLIVEVQNDLKLLPYFLSKSVLVNGNYRTKYCDAGFVKQTTGVDSLILHGGSNLDGDLCGMFAQGIYNYNISSDNQIYRLTYLP